MATNYELPEKANDERLKCLGKEVEMKTFKTNVPPVPCETDNRLLVKIICVGDYIGYSCGGRKSLFVDDYNQVTPPVELDSKPLLGVDVRLKTGIRWQRGDEHEPVTMYLQFWELAEIARQDRRGKLANIFLKGTHGALVFWGTANPSSLDAVPKWVQYIKSFCTSIPCVLITANKLHDPVQWIGPGKIFESELALDQFCKDHGFVGHFEIKFRDWVSGEESVFGQAVNCLLENIFPVQK